MPRRPPLSVFLPLATSVVLIAVLYAFHWVSTSRQSRYYDERAFRVLAILGGAFGETTEGLRTVLGASTAKVAYEPGDLAQEAAKLPRGPGKVLPSQGPDREKTIESMRAYLRDVLPVYRIQEIEAVPFTTSTRDGVLRLWPLARSSAFSTRVRYAPAAAPHGPASTLPECRADNDPSICATVDLAPTLDRLFDKLGDDFFDDVVIADATGKVWYQQNPKDNWIVDLAPLISTAEQGRPPPPGVKSADVAPGGGESQSGKPSGKPAGKEPSADGRSPRVNFNMARDVELAGSRYRLYLTPLPVLLPDGAALAPAVIAGLYRSDDEARHAAGAPHTFMIWGTLAVLITYTLLWPVLSFYNMGPKARMQRRHVAYLVASILASAALLTLLALNLSFSLSDWARTKAELKTLANGITANFNEEVLAAVRLLDSADPQPFMAIPVPAAVRPTLDETPRPSMRQQTRALDPLPIPGVRNTPMLDARAYPYFTYMFWVDPDGWQRIKLTVPDTGTPQTQVDKDPYFLDVKNGDLSRLSDSTTGKSYALRMEPVLSPNTHGFFTIIAMPAGKPYAAKVLAARLESLVDPVMPPGFGFAVVDSAGHVKYHANSARNLQENFLTESQNDRALQALLSHHLEGSLWINYMGRPHAAVIQPFTDLTRTPLSLVVFRDETPLDTVNAAIVLVFAPLMIAWTFPFLLIAPVYMKKRDYPLAAIWPCSDHRRSYAHLLVAQSAVLLVFGLTYSRCGPLACAIAWPLLLAHAGVLYPLVQFRWRADWLIVASRVVLIAGLLAFSLGSWAIVVPIAFAAASVPMVAKRIESAVAEEIDLPHLYASMALASLAVVMVAPACVFFKFAHDSIQRLEVAREEKRAVGAFRDRTRRIDAQARDLHAGTLACQRHCETFDRYDRLVEVAPEETAQPLRFTALEAGLPQFFAQFPSNVLGAELQRIALDGVRDARPWLVTPTTLTYDPPGGDGELPTITRRVQLWSGLRLSTTIALVLVLMCLYLWFAYVARVVFLLDVPRVPDLEVWGPKTLPEDNMLVLGHPRTGRRLAIKKALCDVQMLDLAELSVADRWAKQPIKGNGVCLFYFDFDLDNVETNAKKLLLLERLLYVKRVRVILLSSVDPMYFLAYRHGREHGDSQPPAAAPSQLERWAAVLNRFRKVELHTEANPPVDMRQWTYTGDDARRAKQFIDDECETHIPLRGIGKDILSKRPTSVPVKAALVEEMLDQADSYYRLLWTGCTANERLVLFQLARDGWTNPLNGAAIQQLQRRGLVRREPAARIMNDSFRRFVLKSQYPAEVARWESEERGSRWRAVQRSLVVFGVGLVAWHLYAYPDMMTMAMTILVGVAGFIGVVMRLIGDLRPSSVVATSVRSGS
jgi:hypothetical protein